MLRSEGFCARRGRQFKGTADSPDIVSDCSELEPGEEGIALDPFFHIEVKRVERFHLYPTLHKAEEEAEGKIPLILHRKNREEWVAVVPARDFLRILRGTNVFDDFDE